VFYLWIVIEGITVECFCVGKVDDWVDFAMKYPKVLDHVAVSAGMRTDDFARLGNIFDKVSQLNYVCLDVANG